MIALDDFTVVEKIGFGSYSTVYKAYQKFQVNEYVAVKVVEKAKLSVRGKDDIVNEIKVMKMLKHKHIVEMKDFRWDEKNIYIIMEFCDGGDLSTFIKKRHKLPEKVCQKFLQQLAIGLQFLRAHNISHLDLKPQNLLLVTQPKLTLKIGDFGFAQFLSDSTQKNAIRGSPLYMAPEMLLGKSYDVKVDLWSVGVIAYECLFGKAPYSSGTYKELYSRIMTRTPIVIYDNMNLSEDCKDFLRNLLMHDPEKRMNYERFFSHPFLDLEYLPSESNYKKAVNILKEAEKLDKMDKQIEAFNRYCEGLRYLFPIYSEETSKEKKTELKAKLTTYTNRAEQLKCMLMLKSDQTDSSTEASTLDGCGQKNLRERFLQNNLSGYKPQVNENTDRKIPEYYKLKYLQSLCSNTPNLKTAIEIGISAQMYLAEGKYKLALDKFQGCLGILLPTVAAEPAGIRKDLLYIQTQEWMTQAESAKTLLTVMENSENQSNLSEYKDTCVIQ